MPLGDGTTPIRNTTQLQNWKETQKNINRHNQLTEKIHLPIGKLISEFASELGELLGPTKTLFYRPETRDVVEIGRITKPNGQTIENGIIPVDSKRFISIVEAHTNTYYTKHTKEEETEVYKSMTDNQASIILKSDQLTRQLPSIHQILNVPTPMYHKGKLVWSKIGYDERFGSWLPLDSPKQEGIYTLEEAKKIILDLYSEFPFYSEQDKTNAIAALLTPLLRGLYPQINVRTPLFIYLANRERAGKDYCAGITGILYEGYAIEEPPINVGSQNYENNSAELRKKITAALLSGRNRFHSSNNRGHINNAILESALTAKRWRDRVLGKNIEVTMDNKLEYSLSGNIGVTFTPDLANRSITINLLLDVEDANTREFNTPNLHDWVLNNRGMILSALYTLIQEWYDKGLPNSSVPFASFPEWASICGGIMENAGLGNPCVKNQKLLGESTDSETDNFKDLYRLAFFNYPWQETGWISKGDLFELVEKYGLFSHLDMSKHGDIVKFGKALVKYEGRILSDIRMVGDGNNRAARRKYRFVLLFPELVNVYYLRYVSDYNLSFVWKVLGGGLAVYGGFPYTPIYFNNLFLHISDSYRKSTKLTNPASFFVNSANIGILKSTNDYLSAVNSKITPKSNSSNGNKGSVFSTKIGELTKQIKNGSYEEFITYLKKHDTDKGQTLPELTEAFLKASEYLDQAIKIGDAFEGVSGHYKPL